MNEILNIKSENSKYNIDVLSTSLTSDVTNINLIYDKLSQIYIKSVNYSDDYKLTLNLLNSSLNNDIFIDVKTVLNNYTNINIPLIYSNIKNIARKYL